MRLLRLLRLSSAGVPADLTDVQGLSKLVNYDKEYRPAVQ